MNEEALEYLKGLLVKEPNELNDTQIAFLNARRSYLTTEQLHKFKSVIRDMPKREQKPVETIKEVLDRAPVTAPGLVPPPPNQGFTPGIDSGDADPDYK